MESKDVKGPGRSGEHENRGRSGEHENRGQHKGSDKQ